MLILSVLLLANNQTLANESSKEAKGTKKVSIYISNNTPNNLEIKANYTETADTILTTHEVKAKTRNQKVGESKIGGKIFMSVDTIFSTPKLIGGSTITYSEDEDELISKISVINGNILFNGHTYHLNAVDHVNNDGSLSLWITVYE